MEANNFELKPALVSMVQQSQFEASLMEDPNLHLLSFWAVCDTLKLNIISIDAICFHLVSFSLKDKARAWLHSLPLGSFITWDEFTRASLVKFLPPNKITSLRNQITTFTQRNDEMLYEEWEQFKDLLRVCPHHGLQRWMIVQTFYNVITQPVQPTIEVVAGGL